MSVREEFDRWAAAGRDRGMESRHWHTAKHALARMPVEDGDAVLDLGTGSGYAARALRERGAGRAVGVDASPAMAGNARSYTDDNAVEFVVGDFEALPFPGEAFDHAFSMEAIYYADIGATLREVRRVLRPGGTFYCAVDYYEENPYSAGWGEGMDAELTRWDRAAYRRAFRDAGFHVAAQDHLPDRETEIPPPEEFPYPADDSTVFETRAQMVERYRELGTLLTVGVVA